MEVLTMPGTSSVMLVQKHWDFPIQPRAIDAVLRVKQTS